MFINFYDVNSIKTAQTRIIFFFKNTAKSKQKFKNNKNGTRKRMIEERKPSFFWVAKTRPNETVCHPGRGRTKSVIIRIDLECSKI